MTHTTPILCDAAGDGWVMTSTEDPVIALSTAMSDLIHHAATIQARLIVVSTFASRMTLSMRHALASIRGVWAVSTETGYYDASTGRAFSTLDHALDAPSTTDTIAHEFLRVAVASSPFITVTSSHRHNPTKEALLGGPCDAAAGLTRSEVAYWGASEPLVAEWDRRALTDLTRKRMPRPSRWSVSNTTQDLSASVRAHRTEAGVEEVTHALVGSNGERNDATLRARAVEALVALQRYGIPLAASATIGIGPVDLTTAPVFSPPPVVAAVSLGPHSLREAGVDVAWLRDNFSTTVLGRPRTPNVVITLGSDSSTASADARALMAALEPIAQSQPALAPLFAALRAHETGGAHASQ